MKNRKELEEAVFQMAKEDLNATDEEIWDSIAVTDDEELVRMYRWQKKVRRYMDE